MTLHNRLRRGEFPLPQHIGSHPVWLGSDLLMYDITKKTCRSDLTSDERRRLRQASQALAGDTPGGMTREDAARVVAQLGKELNRLCAALA